MKFSALVQLPIVLGTLASACFADSLVLHDGRVVEGDVRGLLTGQDASISDSAGNSITLSEVAATHFGSSKSEVDRTMLLSTFRTEAMAIRIISALIKEESAPAIKRNNRESLPSPRLEVHLEIANSDTRRQLEFKSHSLVNENYNFRLRDDVLNRVRHYGHGLYLFRDGQAVRTDRIRPEEHCRAIVVFGEPLPKTRYLILDLSPALIEISGQPAANKPSLFFIPTLVFSTPESQLAALIAEEKDATEVPNLLAPAASPSAFMRFMVQQGEVGELYLPSLSQLQAEAGDRGGALASSLQSIKIGRRRNAHWGFTGGRPVTDAALALAAMGETDQAAVMAQKNEYPGIRDASLSELSIYLASKGEISKAVALAQRINELPKAIRTLKEIGYMRASKKEDMFEILVQGVAIAKSRQDPSEQETALGMIIPNLAAIDLKLAETAALTSGFSSLEALVLCEIARSQADTGEKNLAMESLNRALVLANESKNDDLKSRCQFHIAGELSRLQHWNLAFRIGYAIESDYERTQALSTVIESVAAAGKVDEAIGLARKIEDVETKGAMLGNIARLQVEAGDVENAVTLAQSINHANARAAALGQICEKLAEMSLHDRGVSLIPLIEDVRSRIATLRKMSLVTAKSGDSSQAIEIARICENPTSESSILNGIATLQIKAGETKAALDTLNQAILVCQKIKDSSDKDSSLSDIATSLAKADVYVQAVDLTLTISDSETRARQIMKLSYDLASEPGEGESILGRPDVRRMKKAFTDKETQIAELLVEAVGQVDDR